MKPLLIVGAGLAGYTLAREVRKLDRLRPMIMITADSGSFYSKPMLSNANAFGQEAHALVTYSAVQMAEQLNLTMLPGVRVHAIDPAACTVGTSVGSFSYGQLVLATGARSLPPPVSGDGAEAVLTVNHLDDYALLRQRLAMASTNWGARVLILGAGLAGCEFADDLRSAGHTVTVVDPQPHPLASLTSPALGEELRRTLAGRGVTFALNTRAGRVERRGDAWAVQLANGRELVVDLVVSATGLQPDLRLAAASGLATGRGILIDTHGRTSAPHIYALGDAVEYLDASGKRHLLPYIGPLIAAARAIARSLNGEPTPIRLPSAPILVKTPSFPLALLPPPAGTQGEWRTARHGERLISRFYDHEGVMQGFGVGPQDLSTRQELIAEMDKVELTTA